MCRLIKVIVVLIYNNIFFDLKSLTSNFHDIDISFRVGFPKKNTKISSLFRIRVNQTTKKLIFSSLCCVNTEKVNLLFCVFSAQMIFKVFKALCVAFNCSSNDICWLEECVCLSLWLGDDGAYVRKWTYFLASSPSPLLLLRW